MVLVEERLYDDMWKQTPIDNSKSHLNSKLRTQLDSSDLGDDVKAKQYQKTLRRFLNIKQRVPEQELVTLNGLKETEVVRKKLPAKKRKPSWSLLTPKRVSQRKHVKWTKYDDE
jgi:hypothetical protein